MNEKKSSYFVSAVRTKWTINRRLLGRVFAIASAFFAIELYAQTVQPTLVGGTATLAQEAVGYVSMSGLSCTATLISPTHILTASHCNNYRPHDANNGEFIAQKVLPGGGIQTIKRRLTLWIGQGDAVDEDDWGVGVLESPITEITPAQISTRMPQNGETVTVFGYGCKSRDPQSGLWERQYREFSWGSQPKTLCPGDSGGPVMIGRLNNAVEIVGVNSGYRRDNGADIWANAVKYRTHITAISQNLPNGKVCYRAHVADLGWMPLVCDGRTGGTTGQRRRMEAIQIYARTGNVCYKSHLAGTGWESKYVCNGEVSGTFGQRRQMEALEISTTSAPLLFIARAHVADLGWLSWIDEGFTVGTTGQRRRMEAVEINAY